MTNLYLDENYIPTLGMELAQGRNFSKDFPTDSSAVILNETAVKLLGFKEPLKEVLYRPWRDDRPKAYHVVGVVKDFTFSSLHDKVGPLIAEYTENTGSISLRVNMAKISSIIAQIESKWKSMAPAQPFSYSFMDDDFNNIYMSDQKTGKLFMTFAVLAIFIACLGLLGLVAYAAEQRTKEIGIRKVLGAGVNSIVAMLSKDFAKLVLIAAFIAFPVAWWGMNKWLQSFAYRISIEWWVFVAAGLGALLISLFTISFQAIKAAVANPVKSLRTE
jgi:putative ABC transport system permease protein